MKKYLLTGITLTALLGGSAMAADLGVKAPAYHAPPPVAYSWTNCHLGAHVGWGLGRKDYADEAFSSVGVITGNSAAIDTNGPIFGGQLGCDYQWLNNVVVGIEGSASGANIQGVGQNASVVNVRANTDFLASVTGRIGWNGWRSDILLYFKGGAAWAHDKYSQFLDTALATQNRTGWTVGAGAEWALAFAPSWTAFVEWDHYDFGTEPAHFTALSVFPTIGSGLFAFTLDVKQRIDTVRVGVNYRFF